jgi:hypothetical protein
LIEVKNLKIAVHFNWFDSACGLYFKILATLLGDFQDSAMWQKRTTPPQHDLLQQSQIFNQIRSLLHQAVKLFISSFLW